MPARQEQPDEQRFAGLAVPFVVVTAFNSGLQGVFFALEGTGGIIPILDIRSALFARHSPEQLHVHAIDAHPNEIAHAIAAREILSLPQSESLIAQ